MWLSQVNLKSKKRDLNGDIKLYLGCEGDDEIRRCNKAKTESKLILIKIHLKGWNTCTSLWTALFGS